MRLGKTLLAAFLALSAPALAQTQLPELPPVPSFNPVQLQIPATGADFNTLVLRINNILSPLLPVGAGATVFNAVNQLAFNATATGNSPYISLQPGGDTNAGIRIVPNGNGNIALFSSAFNQASLGGIHVGNYASWVPAGGLDKCPGAAFNKPAVPAMLQTGSGVAMANYVSDHVLGYLLVKDPFERVFAFPGC